MLGRQRRDVAVLAARERHARHRTEVAKARLGRAKARFLANPLNLLLPFTAGAFGSAMALRRRPDAGRREGRRESVSWSALLKTASTLWGLSLPLREALLQAREARDETPGPGAPAPVGAPAASGRRVSSPADPADDDPADDRSSAVPHRPVAPPVQLRPPA